MSTGGRYWGGQGRRAACAVSSRRCSGFALLRATRRLRTDRTRLLIQVRGFAACAAPEVRATVQAAFGTLWTTVTDISGLDPMQVKVVIAIGMLRNDVAAMDVFELDAAWVRACLVPVPIEFFR